MKNPEFWQALQTLVAQHPVTIDRPRGTAHPRFKKTVYPVDYGFLQDTTSPDGQGIDVWLGTAAGTGVDAVICTVDLLKGDSEIKLLLDCTEQERAAIYAFHNNSLLQKGELILRDAE